MLHRGATSAFVHTKSDADPLGLAAETQSTAAASADSKRGRPRRTVAASGALSPSASVAPSGSPTSPRWSGVRTFSRRTAATNGLVAVPLHALMADHAEEKTPPRGTAAANTAPMLQVARAQAAAKAHFVTPLTARGLRRRRGHTDERPPALMPASGEEKAPDTYAVRTLVLHAAARPDDQRMVRAHLPAAAQAALDPSPSLSAPASDGSLTDRSISAVPEADVIFSRFREWLVREREHRVEFARQVRAFDEENEHVREAREERRKDAEFKKAMEREARAAARAESGETDDSPPSSDDSDSDSDSVPLPPSFPATLFSYPRLVFGTGARATKWQAHVAEVRCMAEVETVWQSVRQAIDHANDDARTNPLPSRDVLTTDRAFAFRFDSLSPSDSDEGEGDIESRGDVVHGSDDGLVLGAGGRLLVALESEGLTHVLVVLTASGGGGGGGGGAGAGSMVRAARVMLQDLARLRQSLAADDMALAAEAALFESEEARREEEEHAALLPTVIPSTEASRAAVKRIVLPRSTSSERTTRRGSSTTVTLDSRAGGLSSPPRLLSPSQSQSSSSSSSELPCMTPSEEHLFQAELLSILSGHAFVRMDPHNLHRDRGAHAPHFRALWEAFVNRPQPRGERRVSSSSSSAGGGGGGELSPSSPAAARIDHAYSSLSLSSRQPEPKDALRVREKIHALAQQGVGSLGLDRFPRGERGARALLLRQGAGLKGVAGAPLRPAPPPAGATTEAGDGQDQVRQSFWELEVQEKESMLRLGGAGGGGGGGPGHHALASSRRPISPSDSPDGSSSSSRRWLEHRRVAHIAPSHLVSSFAGVYLRSLGSVWAFKAKSLLLPRLRRAALARLASDPAPSVLARCVLQAVGVVLSWAGVDDDPSPSSSSSSSGFGSVTRRFLRGEIPVTSLSPFLAQDQASLRAWVEEQDAQGGLPVVSRVAPSLPRGQLTVLAREDEHRRVAEFEAQYALVAAHDRDEDDDSHPGRTDPLLPPRDLLAHLMALDVRLLSDSRYRRVLQLLNEPSLSAEALGKVNEGPTVTLLYHWLLLACRAFNLWRSFPVAFREVGYHARQKAANEYTAHIARIGAVKGAHREVAEQQQSQQPQLPSPPPLPLQAPRYEPAASDPLLLLPAGIDASEAGGVTVAAPLALQRVKAMRKPAVPRQHRSSHSMALPNSLPPLLPAADDSAAPISPHSAASSHSHASSRTASRSSTRPSSSVGWTSARPASGHGNGRPKSRNGAPPRVGLAQQLQNSLASRSLLLDDRPAASFSAAEFDFGGWHDDSRLNPLSGHGFAHNQRDGAPMRRMG